MLRAFGQGLQPVSQRTPGAFAGDPDARGDGVLIGATEASVHT